MLNNKVLFDANVYTNLQGLESLHHESKINASGVKKEVAQQFESLLIQMLLQSMRDTNKAFTSDLLGSEQSAMYNDLYDKQLSLALSKTGIGVAESIEQYLDRNTPKQALSAEEQVNQKANSDFIMPSMSKSPAPEFKPKALEDDETHMVVNAAKTSTDSNLNFSTAADFVKNLWESAKAAAKMIGADPKILLAQAALETNWGKKIIPRSDGGSTKNLFNIKADERWAKESASFNTLEEKDGVLVKEKSKFRSYESFYDSFMDYTNFLQNNSRYSDALKKAANPREFVKALQNASYATDSLYSEKIMDIYASKKFSNLCEQLI